MVNANNKKLRVVTGLVRFHYVNVFEPRESLKGFVPQYGVCLLIPKEDRETLDKINCAIEETIKIAGQFGMDETDGSFRLPLKDGDIERADMSEFSGRYFINATSRYMPEVVDENCFMITDPKEFYSGCYGRAAIKFFPYNREGSSGIGCCMCNVQKLEDGGELEVRISAAKDFRPTAK